MSGLVAELKRRNVLKVGAAYVVVAWLVVQAASIAFPAFEAPPWALRVFIFVLLLGFPFALVIDWMLQLTPDGVRVEAPAVGSKRLYAVAALLAVVAVGWFLRGAEAPPKATGSPHSIAVLPFTSLGEDADATGLAGGLHDTLITQLSKLKGLEVRSRTSVMKYKDWEGGLKSIADELGVEVLLEGSVQRIGNRTVVNAQLIDARSDAHLWAETIDRTSDDLFALQSEIAQRVASELRIALSPSERKALSEAPTQDREAYALMVQGQRLISDALLPMSETDREAKRKRGVALLEAAVARDPAFALAWAALSEAYAVISWDTRLGERRSYAGKARDAAQKALALGDDLPEARYARGNVALRLDFDFPLAVRELEYAAEQAPGNAEFQLTLALAYRYIGRWDDYVRVHRRAYELDPTSMRAGFNYYTALAAAGRLEEARALAVRMAALHPEDYLAARLIAEVESRMRGDLTPLFEFMRGTAPGFPTSSEVVKDRWFAAMASGDYAAALAAIEAAPAEAMPDLAHTLRGDALRRLGRDEAAREAYEAERDALLAMLEADLDPFVEATLRAALAYAQARLGEPDDARRNIARADTLWGFEREPSDGGRIWYWLMPALVALGDHDEALAKLTTLAGSQSFHPANQIWIGWETADLHPHPGFRALMRQHGVDVDREPFAFNRPAATDSGN